MTRQSLFNYSEAAERATRRQHKHDLLLTFMANANNKKQNTRTVAKPRILQSLLSLFL